MRRLQSFREKASDGGVRRRHWTRRRFKKVSYILINVIYFFSPVIILIRILNKKEDRIRFKEKLCFISKKRPKGKLVWLHASSVGEVLSIIPLIEKIEKTHNKEYKPNKVIQFLFVGRMSREKGIFEASFNLSEKYFKDSVSPKSGPSPPIVSISGCSPSLLGNQYSLLKGNIGFPLV